jgi:hypothetical protein
MGYKYKTLMYFPAGITVKNRKFLYQHYRKAARYRLPAARKQKTTETFRVKRVA